MGEVITESGMDFVADNTFYIEKSPLYTHINGGVRSVEFVRAMEDKLLFVEAKTSFAKPDSEPSAEDRAAFRNEIDEICEKFIHSLNLYASVEVGVADKAFPDGYNPPDKVSIAFILVIKNHERTWCKRIETKLRQTLPAYLNRIWKPNVYVVNHETAKKQRLIDFTSSPDRRRAAEAPTIYS
ncbi:MAG: hypothetical protein LBC28_00955 [Oscillospiraceae bacterium]|jgi:hypothetical protein|nr:hypothetical protein [Oscillospiraceae bacterium]